MYNDEELMLFAESYQKMQRKGTAGKKIIGTVSERLNESIDSQIKSAKLKKMIKALLECEKMKGAKKFLKSISLTECTAKDLAKVEKLYKLYEEIEEAEDDIEEAEDDDADGDPDVAVIKSGFISDYKSDKLSLYKFLQAIVEFGQWIMTHGKNEERNVMKSLLAVLEDEFIPKFAELPGATEDSTVDDEPADDEEADDAIPADAEDDEESDTEDDTEDDDVDIDVDAEIDGVDDEPADDDDDDEVEESEEEEVDEADDEVDEEALKAAFDVLKDEKILDVLFSLKDKYNALFISDDIEMSTDDFEECEHLHAEMICEKSKLKSIIKTIKTEFEKLMPEKFKKAVDGDALWLTTKPIDEELLGDEWSPSYYSDDDDDYDYDDYEDKSLNSDWYYIDGTDEVKEHFKLKTDKAIINKLVLLCVGFEYAYNDKNLFA